MGRAHGNPCTSAGKYRFSTRGGGVLFAVDARTGRQRWRTELPMASVSEPVAGGALVVVAGTDDCAGSRLTVAAVRADTGQSTWQNAVTAQYICDFGVGVHVAVGLWWPADRSMAVLTDACSVSGVQLMRGGADVDWLG